MAILEKEVFVKFSPKTFNHYESLGYIFPKVNNEMRVKKGTVILVKTDDLPNNSHIKITKICDICKKEIPNQTYGSVINKRTEDSKDYCRKCKSLKMVNTKLNNIKYENTLEHYAKINNKEYLLKEYSFKNTKLSNEVSFGSHYEYIWKCCECNSEYKQSINARTTNGSGCPYCSGNRTNDTNCLWTTHPEVAKLLKNQQRGNEITYGKKDKEEFICCDCGHINKKFVYNVVKRGFSCSKCGDGISYPEKFMRNLLDQLNTKYDVQKIFEWSKNIKHDNSKLCGNKKYDFYIPLSDCIIETHGKQHYEKGFETIRDKTLEEEQENDRLKEKLAKNNGINKDKYIIIDCRESNMEWIKNSILKSELNNMFDLANIDWSKCHKFACSNLVKKACKLWNEGVKSTIEIGENLNLCSATIVKYLKQGNEIGLCNYNTDKCKVVIQLSLEGDFIKKWHSIKDVSRQLRIHDSKISLVCNKKRNKTGGFKWMFEQDYEDYINEQNNKIS